MVLSRAGVSRNFQEEDYIAKLIRRGDLLHIPTGVGWTEAVVGTGVTTSGISVLSGTTGVNVNSSALRRVSLLGFTNGVANPYRLDWDKKLRLLFKLYSAGEDSECVRRLQIKEATTIGALGALGLGIRMDNFALVGESYGTEIGELALATLVVSPLYQIEIIHYPGSKIEWYVDDVLKGTQSTSAKIPSGDAGNTTTMMLSIKNGATGGASCSLWMMHPKIWQER